MMRFRGRSSLRTCLASATRATLGFTSWIPRRARNDWERSDSNREPRDYESPALTVELRSRKHKKPARKATFCDRPLEAGVHHFVHHREGWFSNGWFDSTWGLVLPDLSPGR